MGAYSLPELAYAYDALEPHIDADTMRIHHAEIHQQYVDRLNQALEASAELAALGDQSVAELLGNFGKVPPNMRSQVRNFGGGHANHCLLWTSLRPGGGGVPTGDLAAAIDKEFGSIDDLKRRFAAVADEHMGSGWVWLVRTRNHLVVYALPNEDSPFTTEEWPLLGLDLWEHASFLRYGTRRAEYVEAFWNLIDWDEINRRYVDDAAFDSLGQGGSR